MNIGSMETPPPHPPHEVSGQVRRSRAATSAAITWAILGIVGVSVAWALGWFLVLAGAVAAWAGPEAWGRLWQVVLLFVIVTATALPSAFLLARGLWRSRPWARTAALWVHGPLALAALGALALVDLDPLLDVAIVSLAVALLVEMPLLYRERPVSSA